VVQVASTIAIQTIQYMMMTEERKKQLEMGNKSLFQQDMGSRHPFVGMVDHISVLPLLDGKTHTNVHNPLGNFIMSSHGLAAMEIGKCLESSTDVKVLYYGDAHPEKLPLSVVRREQTDFFRKTPPDQVCPTDGKMSVSPGIVTVGAPPSFVENFNIRLTPNCNQKIARSLTRFLRERDGGLQGVEALTLLYNGRYEMAGNLLQPDIVSAEDVMKKMDEWVVKTLKELSLQDKSDLIEKAYRVGTTSEMCLSILTQAASEERMMKHDMEVMEQFERFLTVPM
jgi:hypothetical protein